MVDGRYCPPSGRIYPVAVFASQLVLRWQRQFNPKSNDHGMLKRLSIRQKQMLIIMATSSVALLLAGVAFVVYEVISFRGAMTANLSTLASVIGNNSTAALKFQEPATAKELLSTLEQEKHIVAACVYDKDGDVFASYLRGDHPFT